jgi:segregation and condensation protein B
LTLPLSNPSTELRKKVEILLFVHDQPLAIREIISMVGGEVKKAEVEQCLSSLARELVLADKPYSLENVGGGWQFLTRPEYAKMLKKLVEVHRKENLTKAQLETLSVIAYSQPITRFDIESIRGVGCSPVLKVLQERNFARVVGRADKLGAPVLYGTTRHFLEVFGMGDIAELPERDEIMTMFKEKLHSGQDQEKKSQDA